MKKVHPESYRRGFAPILIITVFTVLLLVGGLVAFGIKTGYHPWTELKAPPGDKGIIISPQPSPSDPTANWKTYTNQVENFTFKYPSGFKIQDKSTSQYTNLSFTSGNLNFNFQIMNIPGIVASSVEKSKEISIAGVRWNVFEESKYCDTGACGSATFPMYQTYKNEKYYSFYFTKDELEFIDQILFTFKFL